MSGADDMAGLRVVAGWQAPFDCLASNDNNRLAGCGVCYPCVASKAAKDALRVAGRDGATVHDHVLAQPGLAHVTVDNDRDLLRKLVENIGIDRSPAPRWVHVKHALGHGSGVSQAICTALEIDPHEVVGEPHTLYCDVCEGGVGPDDLDECEACGSKECESCHEDHDCIRVSDCDGEVASG